MDHCDLLCLDLETAEGLRRRLDPARTAARAERLKLLGDPTRLLIAEALAEAELCGCDLGWITGQSDKTVSHHLKRLRQAGLVESRREGRIVFASLTPAGRALLAAVAEVPLP
ncbi:ArsR/SmtB family transcription factor [Patulibacter defluvii]|uniref:ArsR/SmtB family transcription factor n=1 Tax=Patulibacter defluvii TaxID=3095358 RepID=UPI002A762D97|nr:metalloregulator ArsR/SmtB family transcription factor [Patulibacter sp. DM4]